nr:putative ribonuclease H-like domain-containing protein [Tanacetum cinerariifolium]
MQEELLQFKIQNVWILPPGFQDPEFPDRVYKVEKAMYGLYQALRAWYGTLSKYLLDNGFQRVAYLDSDYGGATQDRKSTTGEYVAVASGCGQVLWIQN